MTADNVSPLRNDLTRIISGRPVSLVGNAASLLTSRLGTQIDQGCVVRLNSGIPISPAAQGRRVDIHCFSTRSSLAMNLKKAKWRVRLKRGYFNKAFSVWMSGSERETCDDPQQAFYPLALLHELTNRLGAEPSVGAKTLHMLIELTDAHILMFGFDFKQSTSFYRRKENRGPHDWAAEQDYALSLHQKGRVSLIA